MSSSLRRGAAAAAILASAVAALTACGAGHHAQTSGIRPDNAAAEVDDIKVQNVNLILPEDAGGAAGLSARVFNNGGTEQVLESVRLPGLGRAGRAELTAADGTQRVVLPPGGSVAFGGEGNATALIDDAEAAGVALGNAQRVVFHLSDSGALRVRARVVPASDGFDYYADWAPKPDPARDPVREEKRPEETPQQEEPAADETVDGRPAAAEQPGEEHGGES